MGRACGAGARVRVDRRIRLQTGRLGLLLLKMGLFVTSVASVLIFFEIGLRIAGYNAIYEIYSKPSDLWRHDSLLGWHHEPGGRDVFVGPRPWPIEFETPIEINSLGLRGSEIPSHGNDCHRILFLGDSMVAAFEVEYDNTFPALIAARLTARFGCPVRGINAGVRGYGTDQNYLYYRERGRLLDPDVVVLFHSRNDLVNNTTIHRMRRQYGKGAFVLNDDGKLDLVGIPVPVYPVCSEYSLSTSSGIKREDGAIGRILCSLQMGLFDRSALFSFITLRINWDPQFLRDLYYLAMPRSSSSSDGSDEREYRRRLTVALISRLATEVRSDGATFIVTGAAEQLEALGIDEDEFSGDVTPLPPMTEEERRDYTFERDSHFNRRGHARVVDHLLPSIDATIREIQSSSAAIPADRSKS